MKKTIYLLVMVTALFLIGCADAGKDQQVTSGETVTLDGTASSTNFYGEIKKYKWKQVKHKRHKAPRVELLSKNSAQPTFIAPVVTKPTPLTFRLVTVEKGGYYSPWKTKDEVVILVNPASTENKLPQAIATVSSESVKEGQSVTFDASDSNDTDGQIVSYEWKDANGTLLGSEITLVHTFATVGTHSVTLMVTDDEGASDSTILSVTVNELQPPVAEINASASVVFINDVVTFDANGSSDSDSNVTITQTGSVDVNSVGSYTITYTATDKAGNVATLTRTIHVVLPPDVTPPVLTLNGESTITLHQGATYTELGATAQDERDGSVVVTTSGNVNTLVVGQYNMTYTAVDSAGNSASLTRTVNVIDVTPPTLTLNGEASMILEQFATYTELGATATDAVDGSLPVTITGNVDTATVGIYTLTYSAKDASENEAKVTREVTVIDVTPPVITLNGELNITLEQNTPYTELGATATDVVDGSINVEISGIVDITKVGVYTITYRATDSAGNSATLVRNVTVVDVTPPVITLNGEQNITLTVGQNYEELGATAIDERDGDVNVTIEGNVNTVIEGNYTIRYIATDQFGNQSQMSRNVNISREQPIKLQLTVEQKDFINKKDSFYNRYLPVQTSVNVIAIYDDGRSEEITNLVQWHYIDDGNISVLEDTLWVKQGTYEISASLDGIYSNTITVEVVNDESMIQHNIRYFNDYRNISVEFTLDDRPSDIVTFTLKLEAGSNVFVRNNEVIFTPENWDNGIKTKEVILRVSNDINQTKDITLVPEPVTSNDQKYHGLELNPIIIKRKPEIILNTPSMRQRKGAIRGVTIHFRLTSGDQHETKITLVDPPEGMMIVGPTHVENTELYGIDVEWNVPFDALEGKIYDITAKAVDSLGREKVLTFPIKIPQTTIIPTKKENNELIVIDHSSPLYGMKMKGHNGEDISNLELRSVAYKDVWGHIPDESQEGSKLVYVVFVIDNMPEKLDVKMPNKFNSSEKWISKNVEIYKYDDSYFNELYQWDKSIVYSGGYKYEETPGLTIPHKTRTYEQAGSKIYLFVYQETK